MKMNTPGLRRWGVNVFLAVSVVLACRDLHAQQNTGELDVGVRTTVDPDAKFDKKAKAETAAQPRPRLYAMLQVQQRIGPEKLVKPVDAEMIAREVAHQLDLQGFHKVQPPQKPEIVITAEYGRGMLSNPYLGGDQVIENPETGMASVTPSGLGFVQLLRQKTLGYEAKLQKASYEKLYIEVRAWKYPSSASEKPRVMWTALMNVDDPDHRDLNGIFKEMLAAGAHYFDRKVNDPEVEVFKPLSEGNVEIGTPTEVVPAKPTGK
jgi:hypothetical protein